MKIKNYLSLVKFSHTVFALPFAIIGFFLAMYNEGMAFEIKKLILVVLCMVFARTSAMAFNRYTDRHFDKANPRTSMREIPIGIITPKSGLILAVFSAALFILTTAFINRICFYLSPVALAVILPYSYTKRFTPLCHFILGIGLGLAPVGAYLAMTGHFATDAILFSLIVTSWVAGFDIIYALPDASFDKSARLRSIPETFGVKTGLFISGFLHVICAIFIILSGIYIHAGIFYFTGSILFTSLLVYQHHIVKHDDLSRINLAFAAVNGTASVLFATFACVDFIIG